MVNPQGEKEEAQMKNNRFIKGSGCYKCEECGKLTRNINPDATAIKLCAHCYELGGRINYHMDNGHNSKGYGDTSEGCPLCASEIGQPEYK